MDWRIHQATDARWYGDGHSNHLKIFCGPRLSDSGSYFRTGRLAYFFVPQGWSGRTSRRRPLSSKAGSSAVLPSPGADGSLAHGAFDCGSRSAVLFRSHATWAARQPRGYAIRTQAGVVLPAYISMAEILARLGGDHWRASDSYYHSVGNHCPAFPGSQHRAASVETACCDGSVRIRGVLPYRSRPPQPISRPARFWSGAATGEAECRRKRVCQQAV